jgi:hypothetical protein
VKVKLKKLLFLVLKEKMYSFLKHYPTDKKSTHRLQFLIARNWMPSCSQNPDAVSSIDSPQGGGPMK